MLCHAGEPWFISRGVLERAGSFLVRPVLLTARPLWKRLLCGARWCHGKDFGLRAFCPGFSSH